MADIGSGVEAAGNSGGGGEAGGGGGEAGGGGMGGMGGGGGGGSGWGKMGNFVGELADMAANIIATNTAADEQMKAIEKARANLTTYYEKAGTYFEPIYKTGMEYLTQLGKDITGGKYDLAPYQPYQTTEQQPTAPGEAQYGKQPDQYVAPEFQYKQDPGYQWQLQQGQQGINASASAQGNVLSGTTLKALQKFGTGLAAQDYANAFQRYNTNRAFGQSAYETQLGQYNMNRGTANQMYQVGLGQFNQNRQFGAGQAEMAYGSQVDEMGRRYNRAAGMANLAPTQATNLANLQTELGQGQGSLDLMGGNVRAAQYMGLGKAAGKGAKGMIGAISGGGGSSGGSETPTQMYTLGGLGGGGNQQVYGTVPQQQQSTGWYNNLNMNTNQRPNNQQNPYYDQYSA